MHLHCSANHSEGHIAFNQVRHVPAKSENPLNPLNPLFFDFFSAPAGERYS